MKKLIFAVALILVAQFSFAQETNETFELKGKVRFVEESSYEFVEKFGEVEVGDFLGRKCLLFNEKGLLIVKFDINGQRNSRDTTSIVSYEYVYNDNGQIKEINEYEQYAPRTSKTFNSKTKNKYDESGRLIQQIIYFGTGEFKEGHTFTFENGKTESHSIDSEGNIITELVYDNSIEEITDVDANGNVISNKVTNKDVLDQQGNWIKRVEFRGKKQIKGYDRKIIYF
jgi:hypothetical protein